MSKKKKAPLKQVTDAWMQAAKAATATGDFGSHQEIADAVGVSQGYFSGLLRGRFQTSTAIDAVSKHLKLKAPEEARTPTLQELLKVAATKDEAQVRHIIELMKGLPDA